MEIPDSIPFAETVPKRGASCKTCDFLKKDGSCGNATYIATEVRDKKTNAVVKPADSPLIPKRPRRWCCSVWTPKGGR